MFEPLLGPEDAVISDSLNHASIIDGIRLCKARRFRYPTLIFNLHGQFERLRETGRYEKLRGSILARDRALQGSENPMLSRHGETSEARQYSGRAVPAGWSAPYRRPEPTEEFA